jgi:DnaJ-class molecular chaperone
MRENIGSVGAMRERIILERVFWSENCDGAEYVMLEHFGKVCGWAGSPGSVVDCSHPHEEHMKTKTCPDCNGDGVVDKGTDEEHQCPTCGGSGFVPDDDDDDDVLNAIAD